MSWAAIKRELSGPARGWQWPVYYTIGLYVLVIWVMLLLNGRAVAASRIPVDLGLDLALAGLLFCVSRRLWPFLVLMALYFGIFYGASVIKISMLGQPILPEEIHNLAALVMILGPLGKIAVTLPLIAFLVLFVANLNLRGLRAKIAAAAMLAIPAGVTQASAPMVQAMDDVIGNTAWDQSQNFYLRGGTLNFLQETLRLFAFVEPIPSEQEVTDAYGRLRALATNQAAPDQGDAPLPRPGRIRNVHMLLLESFWNPAMLKAAQFNQDPLDPRFLSLWRQAGRSEALSPALGNMTANAEYEVLCGFPFSQTSVAFVTSVKRDVACLPELLRQAGFYTVASHPNRATFWNRDVAYRRIGFDQFWSAERLDPRNSMDRMMADTELFRQVREKLESEGDPRPVFNYMVTIDGHWDYPKTDDRPDVISTASGVSDVGRYANLMHYKSRDVMDIIETLRRDDPDSIIVAFGDHLPILGENFAGYVESGLLPKGFGDFTAANYDFSMRTPLIVIDGRNGPLDLGAMPMYELPRLVAGLLGLSKPSILDLARPPAGLVPRPLQQLDMIYVGQKPEACRTADQSDTCAVADAWLRDVKLLSRDLFLGDQHAMKLLGGLSAGF